MASEFVRTWLLLLFIWLVISFGCVVYFFFIKVLNLDEISFTFAICKSLFHYLFRVKHQSFIVFYRLCPTVNHCPAAYGYWIFLAIWKNKKEGTLISFWPNHEYTVNGFQQSSDGLINFTSLYFQTDCSKLNTCDDDLVCLGPFDTRSGFRFVYSHMSLSNLWMYDILCWVFYILK